MPCPPVGPSRQAWGMAGLVSKLEALHLHLGGLREREREGGGREDGVTFSQQKIHRRSKPAHGHVKMILRDDCTAERKANFVLFCKWAPMYAPLPPGVVWISQIQIQKSI